MREVLHDEDWSVAAAREARRRKMRDAAVARRAAISRAIEAAKGIAATETRGRRLRVREPQSAIARDLSLRSVRVRGISVPFVTYQHGASE